jgi:hypothetical protein
MLAGSRENKMEILAESDYNAPTLQSLPRQDSTACAATFHAVVGLGVCGRPVKSHSPGDFDEAYLAG